MRGRNNESDDPDSVLGLGDLDWQGGGSGIEQDEVISSMLDGVSDTYRGHRVPLGVSSPVSVGAGTQGIRVSVSSTLR